MQITNDMIEDMVKSLHRFNAKAVTYKYDIEKEGEQFTFETKLTRKEEELDE